MKLKRWHEISKNPNIPLVKQARVASLASARSSILIEDRIGYLSRLVEGKDLLDVGIVDHNADISSNPKWLHKWLSESAKSCLGIDILKEDIERLRQQGFNVLCADIVKEPLNKKFDVITCGEVLEHVDNPGQLLASCAAMLKIGGRLIVTLPNPWYIGYMKRNIWDGPPLVCNVDHVAWFDPCTVCELGERQGLLMNSFRGIRHSEYDQQFTFLKRMFFGLTPLFLSLGLRWELFADIIIYEFVLDAKC
jgi:SAM-dependent methyltransferase